MVKWFSRSAESLGNEILENQRKIMGDLSTLNANIASLSVAVAMNASAAASVAALVGTLKVAPDQAAIDAAAANVATATTQVVTTNAALTAVLPVVTPAPVTPPSS